MQLGRKTINSKYGGSLQMSRTSHNLIWTYNQSYYCRKYWFYHSVKACWNLWADVSCSSPNVPLNYIHHIEVWALTGPSEQFLSWFVGVSWTVIPLHNPVFEEISAAGQMVPYLTFASFWINSLCTAFYVKTKLAESSNSNLPIWRANYHIFILKNSNDTKFLPHW